MGDKEKTVPAVRTGQGSRKLGRDEFIRRFHRQFESPAYGNVADELARITETAWKIYDEGDKAPVMRPAGKGFQNPEAELSAEWMDTRDAIIRARSRHDDPGGKSRVLLISASPRTDDTCPGEMAKSFRLASGARKALQEEGCETDFLDLSDLNSEYGRKIYPCKACVSTSMPLCHWPCSCYPNHYMNQVQDWMNELYPRWVAAHGIMIITPVHWFQAPSVLKLMIDRLVCADGGNPDPTTTNGKDAALAKELETKGWDYPKHLKGRLFSVIVHGDTEGAETLRRCLHDWLSGMELIPAGANAVFERYIGYFGDYAASHDELDKDEAIFTETRNAALTLSRAISESRAGRVPPGTDLSAPRSK